MLANLKDNNSNKKRLTKVSLPLSTPPVGLEPTTS